MSNGDWFKRHSAWIAGFGGAAALISFLIYGFVQQAGYNQYSKSQATNYAAHAAEEQKQACVGTPSSELTKCRAKAQAEYDLKANAGYRDYSDLIAQRKSALWAMIMGIAALIGMVLSVIGVILVKRTFDETQRTNLINMRENARSTRRAVAASRETAKALVIAQKNADVAEMTVKETQRIGEAQVRCYLSAVSAKVVFFATGEQYFYCAVKNAGQSPAVAVTLQAQFGTFCTKTKEARTWQNRADAYRFEYQIPSGGDRELGAFVFKDEFAKFELDAIAGGTLLISLNAIIVGKDVFGKDFTVEAKFTTMPNDIPRKGKGLDLSLSAPLIEAK